MAKSIYELGNDSADFEIQRGEELELQEDLTAAIPRGLLHGMNRAVHEETAEFWQGFNERVEARRVYLATAI